MKGVHILTPFIPRLVNQPCISNDAYYLAFQHDSGYFASNKLSTKTSTWGLSSSGM